jgi:hypothetical protein
LRQIAPTLFIHLAADAGVMEPRSLEGPSRPNPPVVYLGQYAPSKTMLLPMLFEAMPYGLQIFGMNWDHLLEYSPTDDETTRQSKLSLFEQYQGVLPLANISTLYSDAKVVLGVTEDKQKQLGMVSLSPPPPLPPPSFSFFPFSSPLYRDNSSSGPMSPSYHCVRL